MKTISIVIPVYNEEKFISQTLDTVCNADTLSFQKQIIVVDDGSKDETKRNIEKFIKLATNKYPTIKIRTLYKKVNQGKGAAVRDGFLLTTGDIVLIQDADLEYSPEDITLLLEPFIKNNADVVYGSRFISNRPHRVLYFWHYQINKFLTTLSNMLTNFNLTDMETGYKAFKGELIRTISPQLESNRFGFEPEITARIAKVKDLKIYEVGISYSGRTYSEGKKIGWKDGVRALFEIIKYNIFR
jgi:glycosyltransferase involved in cell wall biosynthesis